MKGLFIPEITAEMFRNGCLESIETLMAEGEIYDIDYQQPCEDAISRQAVDEIEELMTDINGDTVYAVRMSDIRQLPPVTPQPKYEDIAKAFQFGLAFGFGEKHDEMDKVIDGIKKVITPQPKTGHWIPVSERLPEKGKQVLCCNKSGSVFTSAITYINSNGMVAFGQHYEVIAWMPLPDPYEPQEREKV